MWDLSPTKPHSCGYLTHHIVSHLRSLPTHNSLSSTVLLSQHAQRCQGSQNQVKLAPAFSVGVPISPDAQTCREALPKPVNYPNKQDMAQRRPDLPWPPQECNNVSLPWYKPAQISFLFPSTLLIYHAEGTDPLCYSARSDHHYAHVINFLFTPF